MTTIVKPGNALSQPFFIRPGKQVTIHAVGLQGCDKVEVDILDIEKAGDPKGWCCVTEYGVDITSTTPLRCRNGARVILTATHPFATLSTPQEIPLRVRVVSDDLADVSVYSYETAATGLDVCPCVEPYSASYPLVHGGFGFMAGDEKDCDATVEVTPCLGGPSLWVYPTARIGATAPVYDGAGTVVGYAPNQSQTAIAAPATLPPPVVPFAKSAKCCS